MAWVNVTCRCGIESDLDKFCSTPVFGQLPPGYFQCPSCKVAWQRKEKDHRIVRHGSAATIVAGRVEVSTVESRL